MGQVGGKHQDNIHHDGFLSSKLTNSSTLATRKHNHHQTGITKQAKWQSGFYFFCKFLLLFSWRMAIPPAISAADHLSTAKETPKRQHREETPGYLWVSCPPPKRLSMPLKCQMPSRVLIPDADAPKPLDFFVFFPRPLFFLSSISYSYASKLASRTSRWKDLVLSCRDRLLRWKG